MRRILIILEAATIGMVTAFGFLSLWHDWKMSHGPQAVVLQIHIPPMNLADLSTRGLSPLPRVQPCRRRHSPITSPAATP